jgi:hypothetical protein
MLGDLGGELVEVVAKFDLAAQHAEGFGYGTPALHGYEPRDGAARALDDDLLPALRQVDQARELALRFVHSDADHARSLAPD